MVLTTEIVNDFKNFIKKKGLKYTSEREEILKEILKSKDHFDVDELYMKLRKKGSKVSKASVYRTIPLLVEAGYIQEVYKQDARSYYELTLDKLPHIHFICVKCKNVDEIIDKYLAELIQKEAKNKDYTPLTYHLEIFGICSNCKRRV
ncbi:MAG: transcriptional repressor [Thermodesulfobacterium geofontis]|uniref:Ferric uptake regulation protein n=1 Tax=Thermodesulfobacterium geofontis TaxID=1295609 RepID=A0A2N7QCI5_9BACT|nr:MAG: transcriptional repressor [Thermodesulfobacterium geofontis]PMP96249.1 MAG: transcriptional repressor [Thermodesulfobacterium geofontis]